VGKKLFSAYYERRSQIGCGPGTATHKGEKKYDKARFQLKNPTTKKKTLLTSPSGGEKNRLVRRRGEGKTLACGPRGKKSFYKKKSLKGARHRRRQEEGRKILHKGEKKTDAHT